MNFLLITLSLALATEPIVPPDRYGTGLVSLATQFAAHHGCSCAYVMERDEDFCRAWIRVSPDVAKVRFDHEEKSVRSRALLFWRSEATYLGKEQGCALTQ